MRSSFLPSGHLGAYYGYSAHQVESIYAEERIPLLEVYSPKIEKVLGHFATSRTVFLRPASTDFLEDRMLERGQNPEEIQRRMEAVNEELAFFEGGQELL